MEIIAYLFLIVLQNFLVAWLNIVLRRGSYRNVSLRVLFSHLLAIVASALFLVFTINEGTSLVTVLDIVLFLLFGYLAIYDLHFLEIPLIPALVLVGLSFIKGLINFLPEAVVDPYWILGLLLPIIIIFVVSKAYKRQVFGEGDYLIILAMGLTLGTVSIPIALETTILIGGFGGMALASYKKESIRKLLIPMVPALFLGWLVGLAFGEEIWNYLFVA